jgi:mannose-6-phosphate isomerase
MKSVLDEPFQLVPSFRERVWGRRELSPFFPAQKAAEPIGEVWFTAEDNLTSLGKPLRSVFEEYPESLGTAADTRYPSLCPLLLKLLFTTGRLSVQVHPSDEYAARHHQSLGKTEAWYVVDSQPPGEVAIGFRESLTRERLKSSALSGEIEQLLDWRKVYKGDLIFVPAGTVHAIGAGLTICEIQENSDITYRLYDYGRARELHLSQGSEVSILTPYTHVAPKVELSPGRTEREHCPYFRIEHLTIPGHMRVEGQNDPYFLLVCLNGVGTIAGAPFAPCQVWFVPAKVKAFVVEGPDSEWLLTYKADSPYEGIRLT